jgi:regulator of sirC expression with transglutaminase-like and TPR domain
VTQAEAEAALRAVGTQEDGAIDLAGTALVLATFSRQRVDLDRYRAHLAALAREVGEAFATGSRGGEPLAACRAALDAVLFARYDYAGDELTYDDLQNANLIRVIDRRRGLPVALSILYIHAARAQGWSAEGVGFPGHFLVRLRQGGASVIVDPFRRGAVRDTAQLRRMLKVAAGEEAELAPEHYAAIGNRAILLRLENNIKLRLMQNEELVGAAAVIERMLLMAPQEAALWREAGMTYARLGNLRAAVGALERFIALTGDDLARHRAARQIQELKGKLN